MIITQILITVFCFIYIVYVLGTIISTEMDTRKFFLEAPSYKIEIKKGDIKMKNAMSDVMNVASVSGNEEIKPKNPEAKERVIKELDELSEKIAKLAKFTYSTKPMEQNLSRDMKYRLRDQLRAMEEYAAILVNRLEIWDMEDREDFNYIKSI